jgi:hypothetical protein
MEDLLTSDVFGTMLYAGWQPAFARWLAQAQFVPGCDPSTCIADFLPSDNGADIAYSFWPRLPNNREPDVALWIVDHSGQASLLVIEAKYHSGLSGERQLIDEAVGVADLTSPQLRKWTFRPSIEANRPLHRRALIYVTADSVMPAGDLDTAVGGPNFKWPVSVFWLSWKWLSRHVAGDLGSVSPNSLLLLRDLSSLMKRKRLVDFTAFSRPPLGPLPSARFFTRRELLP